MPKRFTICLITLVTLAPLAFPSPAAADPRLLELMFARDVVLREPVGPFFPGAHCEGNLEPSSPIPVIDSQVENRVFFWSLFTNATDGVLRHSWIKDGVEIYGENINIRKSGWWRSWSGKDIASKKDAGRWKVVVSKLGAQADEVLCVVHFMVK